MKKSLLSAFLLAGAGAAAVAAQPEFRIGTTMHYTYNEGIIEESLSLMQQGGHNTWRGDALWPNMKTGDIRPNSQKAIDVSSRYGISPLIIIDGTCREVNNGVPVGKFMPLYAKAAEKCFQREMGKVNFFQLWNEWDGGNACLPRSLSNNDGLNTPENYLELIKLTYPIVKKSRPEVEVISNPFCSGDKFLFREFELGLAKYCDAYAIHTYNMTATPEQVYDRICNIQKVSAQYNNGKPHPFYVTEMSWYTSEGTVSEETQGDYCARFYLLLKTLPACRGVIWYNFNDRGFDCRKGWLFWGLTMRDMTPKAAFYTLQSVAETVKKGKFIKFLPVKDPSQKLLLFEMPDGTYTLAAWTVAKNTRTQIILDRSGAPKKAFTLTKCGHPALTRHWGYRDQALERDGNKFGSAPFQPDRFSFHTTTRPVLISGLPRGFQVASITDYYTPQPAGAGFTYPTDILQVTRKGNSDRVTGARRYSAFYGFSWGGDKDLSFVMTGRYTNHTIHLTFDVTDDKFADTTNKAYPWDGDSIQLCFAPQWDGQAVNAQLREYVLSGTPQEPRLVTRGVKESGFSTNTKATLKITRKSPTRLCYEFAVPFTELTTIPHLFKNGHRLLMPFNAIVNDNDGKGRKGFLFWTHGLGQGGGQDVSKFGALYFK